ncbi:MAG TPA: ABC transporter permease [Solirubrobacteraceae bacterium]|jgi:ABC-2 type transport system permease protein|nr:ABC transporter permease [Solirubrobacteraceae bacterium]
MAMQALRCGGAVSASEGVRLPIPRRAPVSHRVHGPSALGDDLRRFCSLTFTLARTEFKLRFYGSVLGYVWTLVRPLLLFGVLWVFFTKVGHVNNGNRPGERFYGAQLLGSIVLFTFFAEATAGAVRSVVDRENLVRKIHFPRLVIPLSVVLLALFNLGLNLIVVAIFALAAGVEPMLSWLELPLILGALIICATGVAMLLSALFVHFRDIQPIWEVIQQILFYASPVIISIETVIARLSPTLLHVYMLNPLAVIFQQFRHAMITNASPSAGQVLGSWAALGGALAIVLAIFVVGFMVFNRAAAQIAENL